MSEIGLEHRIETPENVVMNYQLAGPGVRLAAYTLDALIRFVTLFLVVMFVLLFASMFGQSAAMMGTGFILVVYFVNDWGYFVISEWLFRGKTIGKHALGIRVIHEKGHPIGFWSAATRNLLRYVDGFPYFLVFPFFGVGFLSTAFSKNQQRLGDLVAQTIVIRERQINLPKEPVIFEKINPIPREEIGSFQPSERTLTLIDEFLSRRHVLSHEDGHKMAFPLALVLAKKLNFRGDSKQIQEFPMAFLARVYVTMRSQFEEDLEEVDYHLSPLQSVKYQTTSMP